MVNSKGASNMVQISVTQLGDKKDRSYRIKQEFTDLKTCFTVKGIGKDFIVFEGDQQLACFKTLTGAKNFIEGLK
jgi:hypothetical protein